MYIEPLLINFTHQTEGPMMRYSGSRVQIALGVIVLLWGCGSGGGNSPNITVNPPPTITTEPTSRTVRIGQATTFSVTASGTGALTYQWLKNGAAIIGATSSSYTTPATTSADNGALFSVVVGDSSGQTATSNPATVTVITNVGVFVPTGSMTTP